jgi:hypothetical protein
VTNLVTQLIVFIALMFYAMRSSPGAAAAAGFLVGLVEDALTPAQFGAGALAHTVVGYLAAWGRAVFFAENLVVNAAFVRRYFPDEEALGKYVQLGWSRDSVVQGGAIVGIVGDVRQFSIAREAIPELYLPFAQTPVGRMTPAGRIPGMLLSKVAGVFYSGMSVYDR